MAEFLLPTDTTERYAAIEQAYIEDRWPTVISKGQDLLKLLQQGENPKAQGLANRVRLLIGHAHLYGLGEAEGAADYYRRVLAQQAEPELRRIASESLQQCNLPPAPRASAALEAPGLPFETGIPVGTEAAASALPQSLAPSLETAAKAPPAAAPWAELPTAPLEAGNAAATIDDPFLTAVATAAAAKGATGAATANPTMPWLADLDENLLNEGILSKVPAQPAASDPLEAATAAAPPQPPSPTGGLSLIPSRAEVVEQEAELLEVDVVEEPELLEVVQADPSLSEEIELELSRIRERRSAARVPPAVSPAAGGATAPDLYQEDPELVAGLLRVVIRP
jgi:hypothetical protein